MSMKNSQRVGKRSSRARHRQQERSLFYDTTDSETELEEQRPFVNLCESSQSSNSADDCRHDKKYSATSRSKRNRQRKKSPGCGPSCSKDANNATLGDIDISIVEHHIAYKFPSGAGAVDEPSEPLPVDHDDRTTQSVDRELEKLGPALSAMGLRNVDIAGAINDIRRIRMEETARSRNKQLACVCSSRDEAPKVNQVVSDRREVQCHVRQNGRRFRQVEPEPVSEAQSSHRRHRNYSGDKIDGRSMRLEMPVPVQSPRHSRRLKNIVSRPPFRALMSAESDRSEYASSCESGFHTFSPNDDSEHAPPLSRLAPTWRPIVTPSNSGTSSSTRSFPSSPSSSRPDFDIDTPLPPLKGTPRLRRKNLLPPLPVRPIPEHANNEVVSCSSPRFSTRVDGLVVQPRNSDYVSCIRVQHQPGYAGERHPEYELDRRQQVIMDSDTDVVALPWSRRSLPPITYESMGEDDNQETASQRSRPLAIPQQRGNRFDFYVKVPPPAIMDEWECQNRPQIMEDDHRELVSQSYGSPQIIHKKAVLPTIRDLPRIVQHPHRIDGGLQRRDSEILLPSPPRHPKISPPEARQNIPTLVRSKSFGAPSLRRKNRARANSCISVDDMYLVKTTSGSKAPKKHRGFPTNPEEYL